LTVRRKALESAERRSAETSAVGYVGSDWYAGGVYPIARASAAVVGVDHDGADRVVGRDQNWSGADIDGPVWGGQTRLGIGWINLLSCAADGRNDHEGGDERQDQNPPEGHMADPRVL
jgi:hypothetical protein